jgi:hypothetical protein
MLNKNLLSNYTNISMKSLFFYVLYPHIVPSSAKLQKCFKDYAAIFPSLKNVFERGFSKVLECLACMWVQSPDWVGGEQNKNSFKRTTKLSAETLKNLMELNFHSWVFCSLGSILYAKADKC